MIEKDIIALADEFWSKAGCPEDFPRTLESAVVWVLPLAIVKLPKLDFDELLNWLSNRGISIFWKKNQQRFRACLVAKFGKGIVFLDGSDSEDERRFSLAHEVSHFMCDYLMHRQQVFNILGKDGLDVLDGVRPPTPEERLRGIFSGVKIGPFTHFMERSEKGDIVHLDILRAEDRAERLALELIAPKKKVLLKLKNRGIKWHDFSAISLIQKTLIVEFGLPKSVAERYRIMIVRSQSTTRTFREWLKG